MYQQQMYHQQFFAHQQYMAQHAHQQYMTQQMQSHQNDHEHDPNTTVDEDMHHHVANIQPKHDNLEDTDDRDAKRQRIEPTPLDHTDIEPNGIDEMIPTHDV